MVKCRRMKRPPFVKELDIFLTMKVLENTPAVLSLGKLCDENGYSYEWINGQKPHLIKNGIRIQCDTENFVPIVVPGLSTSSSSSLPSSTSMTPSRQEIDHLTSSSNSSTSPTMTSSTVSSESVTRQERWDLCGIDSCPAAVSSKHVERQERGDLCSSGIREEQLLTKPTKNPKPNKNEDHDQERWDVCHSDIPEWLQEFRENHLDDRVPEHRDSHASSSHELSLEPKPARSADLRKHSVFTHFPKDRNCDICQRTKITRVGAEDALAEPYLGRKIWWFDNSRSQSSQWRLWISKQSSICSRGAGLSHSVDPVVSVQNKNFSGKTKELSKVLGGRIGSVKSFTLTIPWNSAKPVKISPGIIARLHHTDRKQMELLREQHAEWKKVHLQYCCNQNWMKVGGQILWNVIPICQTSQICYLMGRRHTKDVLENHLKDHSFRLVHWLSNTLFLPKTSKDCQGAQDKQLTQYLLIPRSKWKMLQNYWKFQNQNVQTFVFVYHHTNGQNHESVWKT